MKIKSITKRTKSEEKELKRLKEKQILTNKEELRKFTLEMKSFWNCEY